MGEKRGLRNGVLSALQRCFIERRVVRAEPSVKEAVWSVANAITLGRAVISSAVFVLALVIGSHLLLLAAVGVSMVGDTLDGLVARALREETALGAQLDVLADRMATLFVMLGALSIGRGGWLVAAACVGVWVQHGVVDQLLAGQFLRFGLWSPDHFHAIDEGVWRRNWSSWAKMASCLPVALLAVGGGVCWWLALSTSLMLAGSRVSSYGKIKRRAGAWEEGRRLVRADRRVGSRGVESRPPGTIHARDAAEELRGTEADLVREAA
jgi:hypothetical protein